MITSEKIDQLAIALNKAQAEIEGAKKTSTNPFFHSKYADLAEVWDTCREPLTKNGLCFVQSIGCSKDYFTAPVKVKDKTGERDGQTGERDALYVWLCVTSRVLHISEQWIEDQVCLPVEADPQAIGKVTTYIRRYAQMAMLGIAPEDDDGEGAAGRGLTAPPRHTIPPPASPPQGQLATISEPQRKRLYAIAKKSGWQDDAIKFWLAGPPCCVTTTAAIKKTDYEAICAHFEQAPPATDTKWMPPIDCPGKSIDCHRAVPDIQEGKPIVVRCGGEQACPHF